MRNDIISKVSIDEDGRLCIWPVQERFDLIYRSAAEVHWDRDGKFLFSPRPREWSYLDWFQQIVSVALDEYGVRLSTSPETEWVNVEPSLQKDIELVQVAE